MTNITFNLNGKRVSLDVQPFETLNDVLRERLGLVGTKKGCDTGGCGACTVIVDGKAIYSCMYLSPKLEGSRVVTVEGLGRNGELDTVQRAFIEQGGLQCGYCTPGFIMSAKALLSEVPRPSEREIREGLVGNLCRCTGYAKIVKAVLAVAAASSLILKAE
jgi:aerobic-type carbon monoxide dehydrogenase small subunit (CoxS/CutS family)